MLASACTTTQSMVMKCADTPYWWTSLGVHGPDDRRRVIGVGRAGRDASRGRTIDRRAASIPFPTTSPTTTIAAPFRPSGHLVEVARHAGLGRDVPARDVDQREPRRLARSEHVLERADPLELGLAGPLRDRRARRRTYAVSASSTISMTVIDRSHEPSTSSARRRHDHRDAGHDERPPAPEPQGRAEDRHELDRARDRRRPRSRHAAHATSAAAITAILRSRRSSGSTAPGA